ncbi:MAG: nuclear transport factor 2 family protein [Halioglobus sp.]|nr:nuclear transport factor 2 family protein [Halioglobus sp.]
MLTPQDDLALRNLMARYVDAVNRFNADAWIDTWSADGVWNLLGNPVTGRDNVLALWQQMMQNFEFALLLPSSCCYEVDGDTARGHWYLQEYGRDKAGNTSALISRYNDICVRESGRWRYSRRDYHILYNGPPDLSGVFARGE